MTAVGKILVFFVLLFSLAVGFIAVLNYSVRVQWAANYEKLRVRVEVAEASRNTYQVENDRLVKDREKLNARLTELAGKAVELKSSEEVADQVARALADAQKQIRDQRAEVERLTLARAAAEKKSSQQEVVATTSLEDVKRRQADVEKVRETLDAETKLNTSLVKEKNELRDRAVAAEIQSKSLRDINARLEATVQEMARDMARIKSNTGSSGGSGVARNTNPPPENVEGLIKRTDPNSGLVTLSLGSDAGLVKGNTMEVFRLGATPKYVGRIKIINVTATEAVGQPAGRLNGSIQTGDRVASRIMGGN